MNYSMVAPKTFALQLVSTYCPCQGCEKKLKNLLQKIGGVHSIATDLEQGKVTIQGTVDPHKVIEELKKKFKIKAEVLWENNPQKNNQDMQIVLRPQPQTQPQPMQEFNDQNLVSQVQQFSHIKGLKQMEVTYSKTVKVTFKGKKGDELSQESDTKKKIVMGDDDDEHGGAAASGGGAASSCCCDHHVVGNNNSDRDGNWPPPEPNYNASAPPWPGTYAYPYPYSYVEENPNSCKLM
ncbi:heavy metal-associated isoprenylated plant protein 34-like [Actinidia eriantha]|uniref:heavy metal-associated isoprenylated plant protein 34-like n=1 Tax=Actinidia eriantha TaxID=165200 RepID=UPI00258C6AC0|nr:heavy metal-associated isoprenylated plant protein 34-like [Actinidia eriantha]